MAEETKKSTLTIVTAFVKEHPKKLAGIGLAIASLFTSDQGTQVIIQVAQLLGIDPTGVFK